MKLLRNPAMAILACGLALCVGPSMAASKKTTKKPKATTTKVTVARVTTTKAAPRPKPSLAKFCAAGKAWVDWETVTLALDGGLDKQWLVDTISHIRPVTDAAPTEIRASSLHVAAELISTRRDIIASVDGTLGIVDGMDTLIDDAKVLSGQSTTFLEDAEKFAAYLLEKCGVDMKAPFASLAAH